MSLFSATYLVPWMVAIPFATQWYRVRRGDWKQWQPFAVGIGLTTAVLLADLTLGLYVPSWFCFFLLAAIVSAAAFPFSPPLSATYGEETFRLKPAVMDADEFDVDRVMLRWDELGGYVDKESDSDLADALIRYPRATLDVMGSEAGIDPSDFEYKVDLAEAIIAARRVSAAEAGAEDDGDDDEEIDDRPAATAKKRRWSRKVRKAAEEDEAIGVETTELSTVWARHARRERWIKLRVTIGLWLIVIAGSATPFVFGGQPQDQIFRSLQEQSTEEAPSDLLMAPEDVRVLTWQLAQQYLQRAYGEGASFLDNDSAVMAANTDPSLINGSFSWVNAPQFESLKWFGKKVPFYLYANNDPAILQSVDQPVAIKINQSFETHRSRIGFGRRLMQIGFEEFSFEGEIFQSRFTLDDDYHPYWLLYITRIKMNNFPYLEKLVIVDAMDRSKYTIYRIDDPDIPDWVEVVYPDEYVEHWVSYWAGWRFGLLHRLFNKKSLYELDDTDARFLILRNNTTLEPRTYWYIPLKQANSEVMGGYVLVDTRSGSATFYNREKLSFASRGTAIQQAKSFLKANRIELEIQEGLLYPIRMDDGTVREAYIFSLLEGLRVNSYIIVDAIQFTEEPLQDDDLSELLSRYRSLKFSKFDWTEVVIEQAYADADEVVMIANNSTFISILEANDTNSSNGSTSITFVINRDDLGGGNLQDKDNEWRELRLAVAAFERGDPDVKVWLVIASGRIVDVDWDESELVDRTQSEEEDDGG